MATLADAVRFHAEDGVAKFLIGRALTADQLQLVKQAHAHGVVTGMQINIGVTSNLIQGLTSNEMAEQTQAPAAANTAGPESPAGDAAQLQANDRVSGQG